MSAFHARGYNGSLGLIVNAIQLYFLSIENVSVLVCARVHSALRAYVKTTADQRRGDGE